MLKNITSFWMQNHHQKLYIYQQPLLFRVELPPWGMKIPPLLMILLNKILTVLLPIIQKYYILLHIQVRVTILSQLSPQNIHQYLINKTQTIENINK